LTQNLEKELPNKLPSFNRADLKVFNFNKHLYNPLIYTNKGMTSLSIKPVELNDGEKDFVDDLAVFIENTTNKDTEIYLLRNQSKTGLGIFVEGNFYPDFILWILRDNKQYISFIDPKGIRNLNTKDDPKINLSYKIKDIEKKLMNSDIVLNSFIISNTRYKDLTSDIDKNILEDKNVLFQEDDKDNYIARMFEKIISEKKAK